MVKNYKIPGGAFWELLAALSVATRSSALLVPAFNCSQRLGRLIPGSFW
jgi:hypothetical protein